MKKEEIVVGAHYTNSMLPGFLFLGVGQLDSEHTLYQNKNLIIVASPSSVHNGHFVEDQTFSTVYSQNFNKV